jgi:hypothetical protein
MEHRVWTVEDHLRDKPPRFVELYERFVQLVETCGPFTYAVAKTTITFKGSRRGSPVPDPPRVGWSAIWICSDWSRTLGS